ncbi:hypothetical protein F4779DRAFT_612966 [Xylariaceae sp. FL0662B]|nr:hypothetical protein F4779DRAFT_612966 [Xylariaceae sp. FL0662B]
MGPVNQIVDFWFGLSPATKFRRAQKEMCLVQQYDLDGPGIESFASDKRAQRIAMRAVAKEFGQNIISVPDGTLLHRLFFYIPLCHAEDLLRAGGRHRPNGAPSQLVPARQA